MILARDEILHHIRRGQIKVDPFDPERVGTASIDLTAANVFRRVLQTGDPIELVDTVDYRDPSITEVVEVPEGGFLEVASRELVLLAHQPRQIEDAVRHGVGLQLSGHTHGGQICPWHYAVYLQQPYLKGLHARGETQIYISEGTGFWGPPLRFGSTAEITEITLRAPSAKKTG